jgi:hypothetical protein
LDGHPRSQVKVQHWGQSFFVGSTSKGKGTMVQSHTLQKYLDHADHENVRH